jgi:hypothetical protein
MASCLAARASAERASPPPSDCDYRHVLRPVGALRPTEEHHAEHARSLTQQIARAGVWTTPVLIERTSKAVMDGHHRLTAAKALGLALVPCIELAYGDPRLLLTSWREDVVVTPEWVIAAALSGQPMPPKTSRHVLTPAPGRIAVPLARLRA